MPVECYAFSLSSSLIQTLTVGPGFPPGQSPADTEESRTITAGRDLHPAPKNT